VKPSEWKEEARRTFKMAKPAHFTNYQHCCECAEHDETLLNSDVDTIGLEQLGNPGWDPLCFCSPETFIYYMPALVRLTLDTIEDPQKSYVDQLVFHLIRDGSGNDLVKACNQEQRRFVSNFLEFLTNNYPAQLDDGAFTADDVLKAHVIWSEN
jgi:hypothetical protein